MVLVDTNVLFSLVVETELSKGAVRLYERDADWHSERHALVELTNVLVRYVRNDRMAPDEARTALALAESVIAAHVHSVPDSDALEGSLRHRVSAYDGRFLVAAEAFETRLVTEDVKLRNAAPTLTIALAEALD